jgi:hypothetical protein
MLRYPAVIAAALLAAGTLVPAAGAQPAAPAEAGAQPAAPAEAGAQPAAPAEAGAQPAPAEAGRTEVPPAMRQLVIDHFAKSFVLPQLVIWKFDYAQPYPTGGTAVCGRVNYPDISRRYVGEQPFFVRFKDGVLVESAMMSRLAIDDPVGASRHAYTIACGAH